MTYQRTVVLNIDTPSQVVEEGWTDRPAETVPCFVKAELDLGIVPSLGISFGDTTYVYRVKES